MSIPGSANSLLLASAAAEGGYQIERSLRFNSADSAYLSRTPANSGNRKTWTWAGWVKRSKLGIGAYLFMAVQNSSNYSELYFATDDKLRIVNYVGGAIVSRRITTAVYRDASAWMHVAVSSNSSTSLKVYVNGAEVTVFDVSTGPTTNDWFFNATVAHGVGADGAGTYYFYDGYLADIHFIDGQALDPTSFGEFDATTGVWVPKAYTGTYGTNGFHLEFADNSSNTATTLGKDTSGNGNNWTPNNLSVTAGAGNDSLVDVPTNGAETDTGAGGEVRGNYCTWNPLDSGLSVNPTNGNLDCAGANSDKSIRGTIGYPTSGKWYCEYSNTAAEVGIGAQNTTLTSTPSSGNHVFYLNTGLKRVDGAASGYGASFTTTDVVGVAFDADAMQVTFYKNNVSQGSLSVTRGFTYFPIVKFFDNTIAANFGQRPFAYTAPSGFKALNTANLPAGTITTSGSFTGNANTDGPFVWLNGVPTAMTINGNAVTFGTHADRLANGFKVRSSSGSYNTAGSNTYSITTTGAKFKDARAQPNP